jgi:hypothetical protein
MPRGDTMGSRSERQYATQADYAGWVKKTTQDRVTIIASSLREAFKEFIHKEEIDIIVFSEITAKQLAQRIMNFPNILKPLLVSTNIAARAIERDLGIKNLDTYETHLTQENAFAIAGYLKPFLPDSLPLPTLTEIDRIMFEDKEIRKIKGQWEKLVTKSLNSNTNYVFKKSRFLHGNQSFELDAAAKDTSNKVIFAVDIKRIEARRDIHKRTDEIANKATHYKAIFPQAKFGAIIYYPFITEHGNIRDRLHSNNIDSVVFAGASDESVKNAVLLLLSKFGCLKNH